VGHRAKSAMEHGARFVVGHDSRFAVTQGHRRGPGMDSLKSLCRTSYWSSIKTIALNCLVFEKIAFCVRVSCDRQPDRRTDRQTDNNNNNSKTIFIVLWRGVSVYGTSLVRNSHYMVSRETRSRNVAVS